MATLWQDIRHALRILGKSPGFTAAAVLTLALGSGANTAIFSVVNAALLRPLPYKDPERLVMVFETEPELPKAPVSGPDFLDWRQQASSFEDIAAGTQRLANLTGTEEPARLPVEKVSANIFKLLKVQAALGRTFRPGEDQPGRDRVVILSNRLWGGRSGPARTSSGRRSPWTINSTKWLGLCLVGFDSRKLGGASRSFGCRWH